MHIVLSDYVTVSLAILNAAGCCALQCRILSRLENLFSLSSIQAARRALANSIQLQRVCKESTSSSG
jgi:hypothetical protein